MSFLDELNDFDDIKSAKDLMSDLQGTVDDIDFEKDMAESGNFENLPEGYYYCEVQQSTFGLNKAKDALQVKLDLLVLQNGVKETLVNGVSTLTEVPKTVGRHIYKYYTFKGDADTKKKRIIAFAKDMTLFEDANGPLFLPTDFQNVQIYDQLVPKLAELGLRIYVQIVADKKDANNVWSYLVSWKRVKSMHISE